MQRSERESFVRDRFDRIMSDQDRGFFVLSGLVKSLSTADLAAIGLRKTSSNKSVIEVLGDLPSPYRYVKKGQSHFVINSPLETLLFSTIQKTPGRTPGQLAQRFPMTKPDIIGLANELLNAGRLKALISKSEKVQLYPAAETAASAEPVKAPPPPEDRPGLIRAFKGAYDKAGRGSSFVFIHLIRRDLDWPREKFDGLLDELMVEGWLAAHPGNPGALTADEVRDSYQDEDGELYITVSWRRPL